MEWIERDVINPAAQQTPASSRLPQPQQQVINPAAQQTPASSRLPQPQQQVINPAAQQTPASSRLPQPQQQVINPAAQQTPASSRLPQPQQQVINPAAQQTPASSRLPQPQQQVINPAAQQTPSSSRLPQPQQQDYVMLKGWLKKIPQQDHKWISETFYKVNPISKRPDFQEKKAQQMWHYPPEVCSGSSMRPRIEDYFCHRLFVWLPKRAHKCIIPCPNPDCDQADLSLSGLYPKVREVLDSDSWYYLITENLDCKKCRKKFVASTADVRAQLDLSMQGKFPALYTYNYACDHRVIMEMRDRGLGNGPYQLYKKLMERHITRWRLLVSHYADSCKRYRDGAKSLGLTEMPTFPRPPDMAKVPTYHWIMSVYLLDVQQRHDSVKASITTTFGRILKMDSTKKVTRKIQGAGKGTAEWSSNVGNEHGQILNSVLTAQEGMGLQERVTGIIQRYRTAKKPPPEVIYVDRDCCSGVTRNLFKEWPQSHIRLDIWHFMRRIASGCNSESHVLYRTFMAKLSQCIFVWHEQDMRLLAEAKQKELEQQGILNISTTEAEKQLSKREKALHCRRIPREAKDIHENLQQLLEAFGGPQGTDYLGAPLFNPARMQDEWRKASVHVGCLQDPPGVQLYMKVKSMRKGGLELPVLRCARGSTSLENFHLHLYRFIPGNTTSPAHFQAFLLEGIKRWNQDRDTVAKTGAIKPGCYDPVLNHLTNTLHKEVWGEFLDADFSDPKEYSGEKIGIEYLYAQTGRQMEMASLHLEEKTVEKESTVICERQSEADVSQEEDLLEDPTLQVELTEWQDSVNIGPSSSTPALVTSSVTSATYSLAFPEQCLSSPLGSSLPSRSHGSALPRTPVTCTVTSATLNPEEEDLLEDPTLQVELPEWQDSVNIGPRTSTPALVTSSVTSATYSLAFPERCLSSPLGSSLPSRSHGSALPRTPVTCTVTSATLNPEEEDLLGDPTLQVELPEWQDSVNIGPSSSTPALVTSSVTSATYSLAFPEQCLSSPLGSSLPSRSHGSALPRTPVTCTVTSATLHSGFAVIFCYICNLTFFGGCLAYHGRRVFSSRHYLTCLKTKPREELKAERSCCFALCCGGAKPKGPRDDESYCELLPRKLLPKLFQNTVVCVVIVALFVGYLALVIYGAVHLKQGLVVENLVSPSSYYYEYLTLTKEYFTGQLPINFVVKAKMDYTGEAGQQFLDLLKKARTDSAINSDFERCWLTAYRSSGYFNATSSTDFVPNLQKFLAVAPTFRSDVVLDGIDIIASGCYVLSKPSDEQYRRAELMVRMRQLADDSPLPVMAFHLAFLAYEQFIAVLPATLKMVGCAVATIIVITALFLQHVLMVFLVTLTIVMIITGIFGFMYFWDITLSSITMIHLVMSVGFSVDFSAHVCSAYLMSGCSSRHGRARDAISHAAAPIFNGGMSTLLGVVFLAASDSYIFITFFRIMVLVIVLGMLHAVLFLPAVLSLVGPTGGAGVPSGDGELQPEPQPEPLASAQDNSSPPQPLSTVPETTQKTSPSPSSVSATETSPSQSSVSIPETSPSQPLVSVPKTLPHTSTVV